MKPRGPKEGSANQHIGAQAHALLDNLQTRVSELEASAAGETDEKKKREFEIKKAALEQALEARKSPIQSEAQLADALDQIRHDGFLLERLENSDFDHVDLSFLMQSSDLFPFFDDASQGKLAAAYEQMENRDRIEGALRPGAVHVQQFPGERRREVGFTNLLHVVDPEVIEKLKLTLQEARFIRTERIRDYLKEGYGEIAQNIEQAKKEGILSPTAIEALEKEYEEAGRWLVIENSDPALLAKTAQNLPAALRTLKTTREEMEALKANRPAVEAKAKADFARLEKAVQGLKPETATELLAQYQAESKEPETSAVYRKAALTLTELSDPESDLRKKMAEFEGRLAHAEELPPEELRQIQLELDTLMPNVALLENPKEVMLKAMNPDNQDARLAHGIIKELERATSAQAIKAILDEKLGAKHLELVPHSDFEKSYRKFSEEGDMVFQEKGDQWKIIIDESVFSKTEKEVKKLKKQLTHELLHLEFERGGNVKSEVRKELIERDPIQWQKIREAYIEMARSKNKKPPHGKEWEDDDILSELYAMHHEMGQSWSKGHTPTDKLNNLLVGAGIGKNIGNIAEKTRGYTEGDKEKTRGYGEGVEKGEEGTKPEESVTAVSTQSKNEAVYNKNADKIQNIRDRFDGLRKSDYLGMISGAGELVDAMEKYNEGTSRLNKDILKEDDASILMSAVDARIGKITDDLNELEDQVSKSARKTPNNEIGIFRKLWLNTSFHSMEDFVQMGKNVYEFFSRRHKRAVGDHAARLGMALFSGTDLGREAIAKKHHVEHEEVDHWKKQYNHLDAWHLYEELKALAHSVLPDVDQLKAIIQILASKGRLNWRNQDLWIALNKLQSAVVLKPGDQMLLHDPVLLGQRMHRALGEIYDYDEYISLERQQGTTYSSEKNKYEPVNNRMQNQLTDRLDELLTEHRSGEHVDPILYESIIEYCIKNGKSYSENIMFHMISGMAEGLLAPDRGLALGNHLNTWPAIDWFTTRRPPYSTADWKKFCMQNFPKSFKKGSITAKGYGSDFKNFYWTEIQNSKPVVERVKKSVGERAWDHDWARGIACLGDANTAKRFLSGRSGQEETKSTAVGNSYVGAVQWLEENAKNPQAASKENFARIAGWITMSEGMLNGTAYLSKDKDINTRANEAMNRDVPREAGVGRHGDATTGQHRKMAERFLFLIDPQFFGIFTGREARSDEQKKALGTAARDYLIQRYPSLAQSMADVEVIDQIYDRIDLIISTMFNQMSSAQFQAILSQLAPAK